MKWRDKVNQNRFFAATRESPAPHLKGSNHFAVGSREMKRKLQKKKDSNPFHLLLKGEN